MSRYLACRFRLRVIAFTSRNLSGCLSGGGFSGDFFPGNRFSSGCRFPVSGLSCGGSFCRFPPGRGFASRSLASSGSSGCGFAGGRSFCRFPPSRGFSGYRFPCGSSPYRFTPSRGFSGRSLSGGLSGGSFPCCSFSSRGPPGGPSGRLSSRPGSPFFGFSLQSWHVLISSL